jgi:hypothetical protein
MSSILDNVPPVNRFTRPVACLAGCELHDCDGILRLQLVRGKGKAIKSKWYAVEQIESHFGVAFRLTAAMGDQLAAGETDYVVFWMARIALAPARVTSTAAAARTFQLSCISKPRVACLVHHGGQHDQPRF